MLSSTTKIVRGTTVFFTTTFFNPAGAIVQPTSAALTIVSPDIDGTQTDTNTIAMTAPTLPATAWTAQWDSRGSGAGKVFWSLNSDPGPPFAVEDGSFELTANPANQVTFT